MEQEIKLIEAFPDGTNRWRIRKDGRLSTTDFVSREDVIEWLDNLQAHGMYRDYELTFC